MQLYAISPTVSSTRVQRTILHLCTLPITNTVRGNTSRVWYLLHVYYTAQLDNDDDKEVDQLELNWIAWQRDYMQNRAWCKSRTSILESSVGRFILVTRRGEYATQV